MRRKRTVRYALSGAEYLLLVLLTVVFVTSCVLPEQKPKSTDKVLRGVPDRDMQERWKQAEAEGKLPPIEAIPTPEQPVSQRRPVEIKGPVEQEPRRPVIPAETVATVQPFLLKPIEQYQGALQVTKHEPGVLAGTLEPNGDPFELYYKLPGEQRQLAIPERAKLQVSLRDEVVASALQRRIVLYSEEGIPSLAYIAEGSTKPYRQDIKEIKLTIEQGRGEGNPPVEVTYAGNTVTLKQGQREKLGEGQRAVEIYLLGSVAISPQRAMLQEGQPFYITLMLYRAQ